MNTCKNCKHYQPETEHQKAFCGLVSGSDFDGYESEKAQASSMNGDGILYVSPDFGCVDFEKIKP